MAAWQRAGLPVERTTLLTMREVRQQLERGDPLLVLDVRQAHEWAAGRMPQAELIEAGALTVTDLVHLPRDRPIATHCGHGQRAATGSSVLEQRGYRNLAIISEGIDDWREAGGHVQQGAPSQPQAARA
jgi:hydroxyacylglutathione hydrolase